MGQKKKKKSAKGNHLPSHFTTHDDSLACNDEELKNQELSADEDPTDGYYEGAVPYPAKFEDVED